MKTKYIFIILIFIQISTLDLSAQNKEDIPISSAIKEKDWFKVRDLYEQSKDSLSDYVRLTAGALVDYNFNNPAGALDKILQMYNNYSVYFFSETDPALAFPYLEKMVDCLFILGQYENAYSTSSSLLDQGMEYMPVNIQESMITHMISANIMRNYPKTQLIKGNKEEAIPFKLENAAMYLLLDIKDSTLNTLFDTGGGRNCITRKAAAKLGIKTSKDSELSFGTEHPMTVVDSIWVGETIITNLIFSVVDDDDLRGADILIGSSILRLFPEYVIDFKKGEIIFKNYLPKRENTPRNLAFFHFPFIKINIGDTTANFLWDTGCSGSIMKNKFYEKHQANLPSIGALELGVFFAPVVGEEWDIERAWFLDNVEIQIGGKTGKLQGAAVIKDLPLIDAFEFNIDGFVGVDLGGVERLIVSYEKLYLIAE